MVRPQISMKFVDEHSDFYYNKDMENITRDLMGRIDATLHRGKSVLLLGPRQTGKTTLVKSLVHDRYINLMDSTLRIRYEATPGILINEIKALQKTLGRKPRIIIDEVQKVPDITDNIQILIDEDIADFIITGSFARKIKNLLPGRVIKFNMYALSIHEIQALNIGLEALLTQGSLPGIIGLTDKVAQEEELSSYVSLYLEEEIRKEALVRNLGTFSNFVRLACIESGNIVNLTKLSQEIGVSHSTISAYYNILVDCMVAEKIEPLIESTSRRKLTHSPKYIFFDLGIRRVAAQESDHPTMKQLGFLFEQFIGLELKKLSFLTSKKIKLFFWRDHAGPEVDFILEESGLYTPIEVKWTSTPSVNDVRHLKQFMQEYSIKKQGFLVCQTPYPVALTDHILAIHWRDLGTIFSLLS